MSRVAKLEIGDKTYEFPIITGSEGEVAIDFRTLRSETGCVSFDPGFPNTAVCLSKISFVDGARGILRYRGYPIEQLAEKCSFIEVAYLLIFGHLPTKEELGKFSNALTENAYVNEAMIHFFDSYPPNRHPMAVLSAMVGSLSGWHTEVDKEVTQEDVIRHIPILLSKMRTMSAWSYRKSIGMPVNYPKTNLKYIPNFLHMMFSLPEENYLDKIDEDVKKVILKVLEVMFISHADHTQNLSTFTTKAVGSGRANLFVSISAGISALRGPAHGGATQAVVETLLKSIHKGWDFKRLIEMAKDANNNFRLPGFGHAVYKTMDPRATIIKKYAHILLNKMKIDDPLLDVACRLEEEALKDDYFIKRNLFPNVDFYSGIVYRALNIPIDMFPVMFAIPRTAGWSAQYIEMIKARKYFKIYRPRQIYNGSEKRDVVPIGKRQ